MSATGLGPMLAVQWRTHRRATLIWMFVLVTLVLSIDAINPGANTPILLPIAQNQVGG